MDFYLVVVIILMATAMVDLIVGVSNDAVNFLNSAIGSKVAPFWVILTVASAGVLMGSLFSSGMMEIARNGIFNPNFFTFDKIVIVFLGVMLTDVILLDFYNSLGLPTSTTVSLVFELLGSALTVGLLIAFDNGMGFEKWNEIINYSSAITIIGGIFLSVFLAFVVGSIIQHIARIIFSFKIKKSLKKYGAIFSGLSITTIVYFLLIKGVKGSSIITDEQIKWITNHTWQIVVVSIVFWSILIQIFMWWKNINPLKAVVLLGTFSLAMAFAGNDLVNFIGVPVAGFLSYQNWISSGIPAEQYTMEILNQKLVTPSWLLVVGGVVMVLTLWLNAKSRKVTETEVSLGRQDEGDEKFKPNIVSRALVGSAIWVGRKMQMVTPKVWSEALAERFSQENNKVKSSDEASFDLIRASINLIVSSALIAYGTSQKLPLSTTFVTFMVAMGSSFADQAWGRESAVYRVAGVINVIAGWLITAVVALLASSLFAFVMYHTGMAGPLVIFAVAAFLLIRSHLVFNKKEKQNKDDNRLLEIKHFNPPIAITESKSNTIKTLNTFNSVLSLSLRALLDENPALIRKSMSELEKLKEQNEKFNSKVIKLVKKMDKGNLETGRLYVLAFGLMQDIYQSVQLINTIISNHIVNHHNPPKKKYSEIIHELNKSIENYAEVVIKRIEAGKSNLGEMAQRHEELQTIISKTLDNLVNDLQKDEIGNRMGMLLTRTFLELRDITNSLHRIHELYQNHESLSVNN